MVDDCTTMMRSADSVRFCGANDRDYEIFAAKADGNGDHRARAHRRDAASLPAGAAQPGDPPVADGRRPVERGLPLLHFREDVAIAGIPVFMTRLGYTAELGYELWVERERALELWDALIAAGAPAGMKVIGMVALDLFRIEGGFIIGGIEYDPTVSPYECGLGWSVDLDKGDFQGREGLVRDRDATELRLRASCSSRAATTRAERRSRSTARRSASSRRRSSPRT